MLMKQTFYRLIGEPRSIASCSTIKFGAPSIGAR
jgi:hypothetical protein